MGVSNFVVLKLFFNYYYLFIFLFYKMSKSQLMGLIIKLIADLFLLSSLTV